MEAGAAAPREARRRWLRARRDAEDAQPDLTIGVCASFTVEPVEPFLGIRLLDAGVRASLSFGPYNQIHQVCFDPSLLGPVDAIVLLWRIEDVFATDTARALTGDDSGTAAILDGVGRLAAAFKALTDAVTSPVLVSVPPVPAPAGFDVLDSALGVRRRLLHSRVLEVLLDGVAGARLRLCDLAGWLEAYGLTAAHDDRDWFAYHQPYSTGFWHLVGTNLADQLLAETRPAPKCLVLDCDNTLWGGIVAEDGVGGLDLGSAFPGSAHQEFQAAARRLKDQGVLLAVASKNDPPAVQEVFDKHDAMVLRVEDIAAWAVGWAPKSQGLRDIARELNIGVDSLVFVDDSDYELAEVAAALPEVRCLRVPDEIAELPGLLASSGLFRNLRVSQEDLARTEMILGERRRAEQQETLSREDFLASLGLVLDYAPVSAEQVARVAQLTNKTNQFNLTTVRRTEAEVRHLVESPRHRVRSLRVSDSFGDYGLVGVAVIEVDGATWDIDTLLMSCRVLGRGVEAGFLARIAEEARAEGAESLVGHYRPTAKNGLVRDLYPTLGLAPVPDHDGTFAAPPDGVAAAPMHITFT